MFQKDSVLRKEHTENPSIEVVPTGKGQYLIRYHWLDGGEAVFGPGGIKYFDRADKTWKTPDEKTKDFYRRLNKKHGLPSDF